MPAFRYFRWSDSFFALPVFIFSLANSPNFTRDSLQFTFLVALIIVFPSLHILQHAYRARRFTMRHVPGAMLIAAGLIISLVSLNGSFTFMIIVLSGYFALLPGNKLTIPRLFIVAGCRGFIPFLAFYVGINCYSLATAISTPVLVAAGLAFLLVAWCYWPLVKDAGKGLQGQPHRASIQPLRWLLPALGLLTTAAVITYVEFTPKYYLPFLLCAIIVLLINHRSLTAVNKIGSPDAFNIPR